jgi:SP family xylose:H+ symportor-like MFS transporter
MQWFANLVVSTTFKIMDGNSVLNAMFNHGFAYWLYGAFSLLAAVFVLWYVPETKGRSLEAIQDLWGKGKAHDAVLAAHAAPAVQTAHE